MNTDLCRKCGLPVWEEIHPLGKDIHRKCAEEENKPLKSLMEVWDIITRSFKQ